LKKPTLFVSIANYKDPEVIFTVRNLLEKASGVFHIRICVFSQIDLEDKSFDELDTIPEVVHIRYDYREAKGVCWARKMCQSYYAGENYYLQIDSHIMFVDNWDLLLFQDFEKAKDYGRKVILTAYPPAYEFDIEGGRFILEQKPTRFDMNNVNIIPSAAAKFAEKDYDYPEHEYFIAGGFLFTVGDFVAEVPYDEEIFFLGEEITLAIRAYTAGYFMFAPTKFICAHLYQVAQPKDQKRNNFWDKQEERTRKINWMQRDRTSKIKVQHICRGEWHGKYGVQNQKLYLEFYGRMRAEHPHIDLQKVYL
jgi:GT2 family glycosyltransferase